MREKNVYEQRNGGVRHIQNKKITTRKSKESWKIHKLIKKLQDKWMTDKLNGKFKNVL